MSAMFQGATAFNNGSDTNIEFWDVANVNTMSQMFTSATSFNLNISGWSTSSVTDMTSMFNGASSFAQPLRSWNTTSATSTSASGANAYTTMFSGATAMTTAFGSSGANATGYGDTPTSSFFNQAFITFTWTGVTQTSTDIYVPLDSTTFTNLNNLNDTISWTLDGFAQYTNEPLATQNFYETPPTGGPFNIVATVSVGTSGNNGYVGRVKGLALDSIDKLTSVAASDDGSDLSLIHI